MASSLSQAPSSRTVQEPCPAPVLSQGPRSLQHQNSRSGVQGSCPTLKSVPLCVTLLVLTLPTTAVSHIPSPPQSVFLPPFCAFV